MKSRSDKIEIKIRNDISKMNNMPCINDELKFFGRSLEVQSIVAHLNIDKYKLIHIFGPEGVGKTAIALYAAKYAFERRFFSVGAFYVDLNFKT